MNQWQPKIAKVLALAIIITQLQGCAAAVVGAAGGTYLVAQDRRSNGALVDDESIELKARHEIGKLLREKEKSHINVISYNNNVLLVGQVESERRKQSIDDAVKQVEKVRHVHNELDVAEPTSGMTRTNDTWITTKIKSRMLAERELNSNRIKVLTEDGVVYLLGIVKPDEEELAAQIARETKGVRKVVKMFERMAT